MSELRCEDLPGRLRDICRGHDKDGNPVLTPEKCERYRKFFLDGQFGSDHPKAARAIDPKNDRRGAVKARVERNKRLIGWLRFLRHESDTGVGDTAHRLMMRSCKSPDAAEQLKRLLVKCGCKRVDAVEKLNTEHPYIAY